MAELLKVNGKLAGIIFGREFKAGPPFGGTKEEYEQLFSIMELCYNSIAPRKDTELFIELQKL